MAPSVSPYGPCGPALHIRQIARPAVRRNCTARSPSEDSPSRWFGHKPARRAAHQSFQRDRLVASLRLRREASSGSLAASGLSPNSAPDIFIVRLPQRKRKISASIRSTVANPRIKGRLRHRSPPKAPVFRCNFLSCQRKAGWKAAGPSPLPGRWPLGSHRPVTGLLKNSLGEPSRTACVLMNVFVRRTRSLPSSFASRHPLRR
jgi:hypothetical protein